MCVFCGFSFSGLRLSGITGRRVARATGFIPAGVASRRGSFVSLC